MNTSLRINSRGEKVLYYIVKILKQTNTRILVVEESVLDAKKKQNKTKQNKKNLQFGFD